MRRVPSSINRKVTIRDIAERAGVTLTTVSSALHGRGRVSKTRQDEIRRIADEMGYRPKLAAQMMRASSTGHVGLVLPGTDIVQMSESGYLGPIMANFVRYCEEQRLAYHIEYLDTSGPEKFRPPQQIVNGLSDGVIIGGYVDPEFYRWLDSRAVPWVSVGEQADYCVLSADDEGVFNAVERLMALGHRRIAYAGGPRKFLTHRLGAEGFIHAHRELGLKKPSAEWMMQFAAGTRGEIIGQTKKWAGQLLKPKARPTAIVCHDMVIARAIVFRAMNLGLSVPEDLSVFGTGLASDAEKAPPLLSSIEVDFKSLVEAAMEILLRRLNAPPSIPARKLIQPKLVMRESVGRAPGIFPG